ncbi:MAG: DUF86 domain-containing protein [Methanosarcinaceae archaeon]|nr:DUF86 domain-containing protein [Methanosarcinaceae archaeon]
MNSSKTEKEPGVFIEHISQCIDLIESYTNDVTIGDFFNSVQLQDSIIRRIEIIGEAVKNLPDDMKIDYPEVPWKEIAGMRDVLIHAYFGIDLDLTWEIIQDDLPELKKNIAKIQNEIKNQSTI